jgi:hypothetical protein
MIHDFIPFIVAVASVVSFAVILLMGIRFHLIWTLVSIITLAAGAAFLATGITNAAMIDYHTQWATESRHILANIGLGAGLTVGGLVLLIVSLVLHFTRRKKPHTEVATVPPAAG